MLLSSVSLETRQAIEDQVVGWGEETQGAKISNSAQLFHFDVEKMQRKGLRQSLLQRLSSVFGGLSIPRLRCVVSKFVLPQPLVRDW